MSDFLSLPFQAALPDVFRSVAIVAFMVASGYGAARIWRRSAGTRLFNDLAHMVSSGMSEREALEKLAKTAWPPHRGRIKKLLQEMPRRSEQELAQATSRPGRKWPAQSDSSNR